MSSEERATYREAVKDVRAWAREAYDDDPGNPDPHDLAWQSIDGCSYVIYYHRARELYDDSSEVREWEEEATECMKPEATIDERMAACVFYALVNVWYNAWQEYESNSQPTEADPEDDE